MNEKQLTKGAFYEGTNGDYKFRGEFVYKTDMLTLVFHSEGRGLEIVPNRFTFKKVNPTFQEYLTMVTRNMDVSILEFSRKKAIKVCSCGVEECYGWDVVDLPTQEIDYSYEMDIVRRDVYKTIISAHGGFEHKKIHPIINKLAIETNHSLDEIISFYDATKIPIHQLSKYLNKIHSINQVTEAIEQLNEMNMGYRISDIISEFDK